MTMLAKKSFPSRSLSCEVFPQSPDFHSTPMEFSPKANFCAATEISHLEDSDSDTTLSCPDSISSSRNSNSNRRGSNRTCSADYSNLRSDGGVADSTGGVYSTPKTIRDGRKVSPQPSGEVSDACSSHSEEGSSPLGRSPLKPEAVSKHGYHFCEAGARYQKKFIRCHSLVDDKNKVCP